MYGIHEVYQFATVSHLDLSRLWRALKWRDYPSSKGWKWILTKEKDIWGKHLQVLFKRGAYLKVLGCCKSKYLPQVCVVRFPKFPKFFTCPTPHTPWKFLPFKPPPPPPPRNFHWSSVGGGGGMGIFWNHTWKYLTRCLNNQTCYYKLNP